MVQYPSYVASSHTDLYNMLKDDKKVGVHQSQLSKTKLSWAWLNLIWMCSTEHIVKDAENVVIVKQSLTDASTWKKHFLPYL